MHRQTLPRLPTIAPRFGAVLLLIELVMLPLSAAAQPVVVGMLEGYSLWQGQGNTMAINELNTELRNRMIGQNYYSRVFEWDQVDEARNFYNLFSNGSTNYLLGYSRGGYQALRVADALRADNINIDRLVQLDPVRCGGAGYNADSVSGCFAIPVNSVVSSGEQIVPSNVRSATNYFQTGGGITGERNVTGANNVSVNALLGDDTINHSTIDDSARLRRIILDDVFSYRDSNRFMTGLGGPAGYGTLAMTRNDDGSTGQITLPFEINFNGSRFNSLFINNNGNVTFGSGYGAFTPTGFNNLPIQMIAPFWADVDTRCASCGAVYFAAPTADTAVITWNTVGYYNSNASKTNSFQLIIRDRNDLAGSNTDVEFRYGNLEWTTGDASQGVGGLGGQPAFAGYSGGANGSPQTLIGSGTGDVLTLNRRSNIGEEGRWQFAFREGAAPGTDINNPLLPDVRADGWHFQFTTTTVNEIVWSDPDVVYGYNYEITAGPRFTGFILPVLGDNVYQLMLGTVGELVYIADIIGGSMYSFADLGLNDGVNFFAIRGVDLGLGIDPADVTAFVTGLRFAAVGPVQWTQSPVSLPVPEPTQAVMLASGLLPLFLLRRRVRMRGQC